jgi:hypothetical protein
MLMKFFLKNVGFNFFVYINVGPTFPKKMLGQLFMKNVGSTFCFKIVVTFLTKFVIFF